MNHSEDRVRRASRIYEKLLWLYPHAHREVYGGLMVQLFRDAYRADIASGKGSSLTRVVLGALPDLARSVFREHLTHQTQNMKNSPQAIAVGLFAAAITAGLLSCSFSSSQPGIALSLAYFTVPLLLLRAFFESKRPGDELVNSLTWAAAIAVFFAFVFPVWAKVKLPVIPWIVLIPIVMNAIVPVGRTVLRLTRPRV
jgi:hypothetical protein